MKHSRSLATGLAIALTLLAGCSSSATRKAHYLERGQSYLTEGKLDKARVELSNALQIDPNDASARYLMGRVAEKQNKPRDAVGNYLAAIEANPDHLQARSALGRIYLLGGLPEKAREVIEPGLAKAPDDAQLRTVRGGIRAATGDVAGAMEDALAAVKAAPDDEIAVAFLAAQYARKPDVPEAIRVLEEGIRRVPATVDLRVIMADLLYRADRKPEALQQLKSVAEAHRNELVHWQRLAQMQLFEKDVEGAIDSLRQAVVAAPGNIDAKKSLVTFIGTQKGIPAALAEMQKFVDAEPANADLQIALAEFQEAGRDVAKAEATYRAVIKSQGTKAAGLTARNRLAALLVKRNDVPAAEALVAEVLKENPRDNDALVLRAGIAMSRNQAGAAITDLRAVVRDQPNSSPLLRALAKAHLQNGDMELGEETLRQALAANPADIAGRLELASLLAGTGRDDSALTMLEQLVKDAPDNVQARAAYFDAQLRQPDLAGARNTAAQLKTLRPDLPLGFMLAGAVAEREKKFAEATAAYEAALKVDADAAEPLVELVRLDVSQRQPARAMARLQSVLERKPDSPVANELVGEVQLSQGNTAAAIKAFDAAIAAQPASWLPYRAKANAQLLAQQADAALATWHEGATKTGSLELYSDLAATYERLGRHDQAIAAYEEALKSHPASVPLANNLAMLLVSHRRDKASLERASQVSQLLAGNEQPSILDTLGWVKYRTGATSEALTLLRKAAERAPKSAEIQYHLGMALLGSGDHAAAKLSLEAALAGKPAFIGVEDARAALAGIGGKG